MLSKNNFTLIELVVIITVLAMLATTIVPNTQNVYAKGEISSIKSNLRNLQTTVDSYRLERYNNLPVKEKVTVGQPQLISFKELNSEFLRNLPKDQALFYWVDYWGQVFISKTDAPKKLEKHQGSLTWEDVPKAALYRIYEVVEKTSSSQLNATYKKMIGESKTNTYTTTNLLSNKTYLVSSVDTYGFESAAIGEEYVRNSPAKSYGGNGNDGLRSVHENPDGSFMAFGYSSSTNNEFSRNWGQHDFAIVKMNKNGEKDWVKTYGGTGNDVIYASTKSRDGNFLVAGSTTSNDGDIPNNRGQEDFMIAKVDTNGNIIWLRTYGGTESDELFSIKETSDGSILVAGKSNSKNGDVSSTHQNFDIILGKFNSDGSKQWIKSYGGSGSEYIEDFTELPDGSIMAVGYSTSKNGDISTTYLGTNFLIAKFKENGDKQWMKTLGGNGDDFFYSITPTSDGGFITAGKSTSSDGDLMNNKGAYDAVIAKFDANGVKQWLNNLGGTQDDFFHHVIENKDGKFIAVGGTSSPNGDIPTNNHNGMSTLLVKYNKNGTKENIKVIDHSNKDYLNYIIQTLNGDLVSVGSSSLSNNVIINQGNNDFLFVRLEDMF